MLLPILLQFIYSSRHLPQYSPSPEIIESQKEFAEARFGIFLHWGLYAMYAQGEWYMTNAGINRDEYAKTAGGFYPISFNASEWVSAIKDSGAKYITFTSRHHEGFSMFDTKHFDYNIMQKTPFKRDIVKELADACHEQDMRIHIYYSHIDWTRDDYPRGRTGLNTGWHPELANWTSYFNFMNNQLTEILTKYGKIGGIWFDGWWDHDEDPTPFDWHLDEQYALIHSLQKGCLIGNNHHHYPYDGEDIQIFERNLPKDNISNLPLETCDTMNGMWGYKIQDQDYKDTRELVHYLVNAAGLNANLLLNIGPQADGRLPETALERLREMGQWMRIYGDTIYGTQGSEFPLQTWGTTTIKGSLIFVHILTPEAPVIYVQVKEDRWVKEALNYTSREDVRFTHVFGGVVLELGFIPDEIDCVIELQTVPLQQRKRRYNK